METEYRIVGSHRILNVLAEDVEALVAPFYLPTERIQSGHLMWTCTGDEGQKAQPGQPTEAYRKATGRFAADQAGGAGGPHRALRAFAGRRAGACASKTPSSLPSLSPTIRHSPPAWR